MIIENAYKTQITAIKSAWNEYSEIELSSSTKREKSFHNLKKKHHNAFKTNHRKKTSSKKRSTFFCRIWGLYYQDNPFLRGFNGWGLEQSRGLLSWRLWNEQQKTVLSLTFQNVRAFLSSWNSISIKEFWMTKLWLIANELRENQATVNILYSPIWWRYLYVYKHNDNQREKFRIKVKCQISNLNEISKWIPNKLCCEDQRVRAWHFQHVSSFQLLSHSFIFFV